MLSVCYYFQNIKMKARNCSMQNYQQLKIYKLLKLLKNNAQKNSNHFTIYNRYFTAETIFSILEFLIIVFKTVNIDG